MFRLLTISVAIVLMTTMLAVADNSVRTLDTSTFQTVQSQPILIQPVTIDGVPVPQPGPGPAQSPDIACTGNWQGSVMGYLPGWTRGDELYAAYQDPSETGCPNTYPFTVQVIKWYIYTHQATPVHVMPMIFDYTSPDVIGALIWAGSTNTFNIPGAGLWQLDLPVGSGFVVDGPYYAGVYFLSYPVQGIIDIVLDDGTTVPPRSNATYNDYGSGWVDLVDDAGLPWNLQLWSEGETKPSSVEVTSRNVLVGQQSVEIPIKINNDVELSALIVPLKIETVSGSAHITNARLEYRDRITGSVFDYRVCDQRVDGNNACTSYQIVGNGACGADNTVASMPEAFIFTASNFNTDNLPPGRDVDGSLVLVVDIGPDEGTMLIDTICVLSSERLLFLGASNDSIKPTFQSGVIRVLGQPISCTDPDCVEVTSMTVDTNQQDVEIPILLNNDFGLMGLTVPLKIETLSGNSSITRARLEYRDRITGNVLDMRYCRQVEDSDNACTIYPTTSTSCGVDNAVTAMPEAFLFEALNLFGSNLPAGNDVDGSLVLVVDIGPGEGTMLIDTSCVRGSHLIYDDGFPSTPSFAYGLITVEALPPSGCTDPNCVTVASMPVNTNQRQVEIPIMIDNDVDLSVIVVPLKIETLSGTASITGARMEYRDRITGAVFDARSCSQRENADLSCTEYPLVGTACGVDRSVTAMPEGFLFSAVRITTGLPAGQDVDGSLVLVVDIGPGEGTMIIDTTCMFIENHLLYRDDPAEQPIYPSFQSGIITVSEPPDLVEVTSMTVQAVQQQVEIPIKLKNNAELQSISVPLKIETLSGTASITGARLEYRDRLSGSALSDIRVCDQREDGDNACTAYPVVGSSCGVDYPVASMPEAFMFLAHSIFVGNLPAGDDVDGSLVLVVDIGPGEGTMLIDTTCVNPANHLMYLDAADLPVYPSFQSGVITVNPATEWDTLPEMFYTIPELYDSAGVGHVLEGNTVRVIGEYVSPDIGILVTSYLGYMKNMPMPPNSSLLLEGLEPDPAYYYGGIAIVTGTVQFDIKTHPLYGTDTLVITLSPTKYDYLIPAQPPPEYSAEVLTQPKTPGANGEAAEPDCDSCKFAILVSSMGGSHPAGQTSPKPSYWNNIVKLRRYKIDSAGYCEEDVFVHYADGNSDVESEIPAARIQPCTQAAINATHTTIVQRIAERKAKCLAAGKKITVQAMFTNHGEDDMGVALLDGEYLSPTELTTMHQLLIDAGCELLIDEFLTCFGGDMIKGLEQLDNKNKTQIHANGSAPADGSAVSPDTDVDEYLNAKIACLEKGDKSYEECVREAERAYMQFLQSQLPIYRAKLWPIEVGIADIKKRKTALEIARQLDIVSDEFYQEWLERYNKELEEHETALQILEDFIASAERQLGLDDDNGEGEGCPGWVKHPLVDGEEEKLFFVEPGGQLEINFPEGAGSGNVTVYELVNNTWERERIWNWNLPGSDGYQPGYETRRLDVPLESTGIYAINNDDGEMTILVESLNGTQPESEDPSNADESAGFSVGFIDASQYEFSEIWTPSHVSSNTNLEGFNLSDVPRFLTPTGVVDYRADYVAGPHNIYWDDMELVVNILTVWQPGTLTINFSSTTIDTSVTVEIDTVGEYHVRLGAIPAPGNNHISFITTAGSGDLSITWDAWSLRSLVKLAPTPIIRIETNPGASLGQPVTVSITTEANTMEMGGFDLLIGYDTSALAFTGAEPGELLPDCDWEYFTYRISAGGVCEGCPDGLIRIIAVAETNDGPNHPSCYGPPDTDPCELVKMSYLVTNDRTFECQYVPIRFFWGDCGDNAIPSVDSQVVNVSDHVYDFEGTDITDPTFGFPTYFGVQFECYGPPDPGPYEFPTYFGVQSECLQESTEEPTMVPQFNFHNGGITILCASECCGVHTGGYTGNTDCDLDGKRNLADITRLIDRVYVSKEMLCCELNGDVDGDPLSKINLADITRLIDNVYVSKQQTAPCE